MKYSMDLNRRRLLALAGTAVTASAAGCSGGGGGDGGDENDADGGSNPDASGSQTDGADNSGDGQGTGSSGDSNIDSRQNVEETNPVEFENYTRTSYVVEVYDGCGETEESANWIGPYGGELGIALGVVGRAGCDVVTRKSETYDEDTQTLRLELDISPLEGATCEDNCMVQNDVFVGYRFPVDDIDDVSVNVFVSENGSDPELRAEYPLENERSV